MADPSILQKHVLDFDIDNYLNRIIPRQRLDLLPTFVSYWFGYRAPNSKPQPRLPNLGVWISALIGGFVGIAIVTHVFAHLPPLGGHQVPIVIASFGAAAILEYNVIESPLSQPRNLIVGHFLSAVVGVAVTKAFQSLPPDRFEELRWLAGSISVGLASAVMGATKTVHPPAGATALLAATSAEITDLGWWFLPLILLAASLMCASALVVNNLTRRWPLYWWTPADISRKKQAAKNIEDIESHVDSHSDSDPETGSTHKWDGIHVENARTASESEATIKDDSYTTGGGDRAPEEARIVITADGISLPKQWSINDWEQEVMEILQSKLQEIRRRQS